MVVNVNLIDSTPLQFVMNLIIKTCPCEIEVPYLAVSNTRTIETLRLKFGDLTTNDKPWFAVISFMFAVCLYLGLKICGLTNSRLPFLFSFVCSLLF